MPNPKRNESKQDFLKRCTVELIEDEGQKSNQAFAICNQTWDENKSLKGLELSAPVEFLEQTPEDKGKPRPFMITALTSKVIDRFWEKVFIDVKGIETKPKFPAFLNHDREKIVGTGLKKSIDNKSNLLLFGNFSKKTEASQEVQDLADEGFPWQASVGILPIEIKRLYDEKETAKINGQKLSGPLTIYSKSKVQEVSFTPLGSDDDTAAIALNQERFFGETTNIYNGGIDEMGEMTACEFKEKFPNLFKEVFQSGFDSAPKVQELSQGEIDPGALKAEQTKERERAMEILLVENAPLDARLLAVKEGNSINEAYKIFWNLQEKERTESLDNFSKSSEPEVKADGKDKGDGTKKIDFDAEIEEYIKIHPKSSYKLAASIVTGRNPEAYEAQRNKN